jgi:membrane associated rhomboid family serine protease
VIPISDESPKGFIPFVNYGLIIINILAFLYQPASSQALSSFFNSYGLVPSKLMENPANPALYLNIFSSMFLHADLMHLGGNLLYLWIFGDNIEDKLGHIKYLGFYLISGILASLIWIIAARGSSQPVVGASGAISAVMAAYLIMYPSAKIRTLVTLGLFIWPLKVPAYVMIGLWIALQVAMGFLNPNTGIAYLAHIGGFFVGYILANFMSPRKESRGQE